MFHGKARLDRRPSIILKECRNMSKTNKTVLRCPTCSKLVAADDHYFPFCSDRCRIIDLGKWASGAYRISTPIHDPEELEELRDGSQRAARSDSDDEY